jgi:hypothetical protein
MSLFKNWKLILLLCLTLGLAPFFPEPHIWGKLKWLFGGGKGMQLIDWFDIFLHGSPFVLLIWLIVLKISKN